MMSNDKVRMTIAVDADAALLLDELVTPRKRGELLGELITNYHNRTQRGQVGHCPTCFFDPSGLPQTPPIAITVGR